MIKKLLFIIFLFFAFSFLFLLLPNKAFAQEIGCYPATSYICRSHLGNPPSSVCCRTGGCKCGYWTLNKWEYCYVAECCKQLEGWLWFWDKAACSTADSCNSTIYLKPGICDSTGCSKGGNYKICCNNVTGAPCSNSCTPYPGGNYRGVCGAGCHPHVPELGDGPCTAVKIACNGSCSTSADCALKV